MAQLPASLRRNQAAITDSYKPPTAKEKLIHFGGWVMLCVAVLVLAVGAYGLGYKVMTDAQIAKLDVVGTRSDAEHRQVMMHVNPVMTKNYFTSNLGEIRDTALELSWVDRVVVSRAWPNAIRVRVMPRHPIARWGTGRLLSDSGEVFTEVTPQNNQHLPLLHGPTHQS